MESQDGDQTRSTPQGPPDGEQEEVLLDSVLRGLRDQVERFHERTERYEHTVREMSRRIEVLQADQAQSSLKPLFRRLAALHAQAGEAAVRAVERQEQSHKDFEHFRDAIEEALSLVDIESVNAAAGDPFDARQHHATLSVDTDDPELDKRIHRVLQQGFTHVAASRVMLPAQVSVHRYRAPEQASRQESDQESD